MRAVLLDAWRLVVPPRGDRHGPLSPLLLGLTVLTGLVDAFSYLALGHVFVANMTGNVVFLAFALGGAAGFSSAASTLALAAFSLGAVGGGRLIAARGRHRGQLLAIGTAVEAVLIATAMIVALVAARPGVGSPRYWLIGLLGVAMGLQNATARKLAVPDLTTTVLTLTITGAAADSRLAGGPASKLGRRGLVILAMFLGALFGSLLIVGGSSSTTLVLALLAVSGVAAGATLVSRRYSSWAPAA